MSWGEGYSHLNLRPAQRLQVVCRVEVCEVIQATTCLTQWLQGNYEGESVNMYRIEVTKQNLPRWEPGVQRRRLEEGAR